MRTFDMIKKSIENKKSRGVLTEDFIESTKSKLDVFLMGDRITEAEYKILTEMLEG